MSFSPAAGPVAGQHPARERAPGDDPHALIDALRDHLPLLLAIDEVVVILHRHEAGPGDRLGLGELPGPHAAGADVAGLARLDDVVQRVHRLLDRGARIPAVDLVEVDVVELQAPQRSVDRGHDVLAREAPPVLAGHRLPVHLGRQHVLLAHSEQRTQQPPRDDLALPAVVDVGGVKEGDPALDGGAHDRLRSRLIDRPLATLVRAIAHHAQADPRHPQPRRSQIYVFHPSDSFRVCSEMCCPPGARVTHRSCPA